MTIRIKTGDYIIPASFETPFEYAQAMRKFTEAEAEVGKLRKTTPIWADFELDEDSQYAATSRIFLFVDKNINMQQHTVVRVHLTRASGGDDDDTSAGTASSGGSYRPRRQER